MTRVYKLTDANMQTRNGFQWELGKPVPRLLGIGGLCSANHYHAYTSPLQAILMNPIQANLDEATMRLFAADGEISRTEYCKCGCYTMTIKREISVPKFPLLARVRVAVKLAKRVYKNTKFQMWARKWLDGSDRSAGAAYTANAADYTAAYVYAAGVAYYTAGNVACAVCAAVAHATAYATELPNLHRLCQRAIKFETALEMAEEMRE